MELYNFSAFNRFSRRTADTARTVISWWNTVQLAGAKSPQFVLKLSDDLSFSIDWHRWPIPTRVILPDRYEDKQIWAAWREGRGLKPLKTGSSLVAVVYLGGDFLLELGELVLREGAGQDLRTPFDEVVDHVADRVEHLAFVALSTETEGLSTCAAFEIKKRTECSCEELTGFHSSTQSAHLFHQNVWKLCTHFLSHN